MVQRKGQTFFLSKIDQDEKVRENKDYKSKVTCRSAPNLQITQVATNLCSFSKAFSLFIVLYMMLSLLALSAKINLIFDSWVCSSTCAHYLRDFSIGEVLIVGLKLYQILATQVIGQIPFFAYILWC
jgi:hypothetical protein